MDTVVLIIVLSYLVLCFIVSAWRHYEPHIDIVSSKEGSEVYLWYNLWEKSYYKGRVYKHLFTI